MARNRKGNLDLCSILGCALTYLGLHAGHLTLLAVLCHLSKWGTPLLPASSNTVRLQGQQHIWRYIGTKLHFIAEGIMVIIKYAAY